MKTFRIGTLIGVSLLASAVTAQAEGIDGKKNLVCAVTQWEECIPHEGCVSVSSKEIDGADLIGVDFKGKMLRARDPGNDEKTEIRDMVNKDFQIVMQGLDYALSWTMTVEKNNGQMAFTGAREDLVFVAFGRCAEE